MQLKSTQILQSPTGIKNFKMNKDKIFKERGIVTKDVAIPVKDKNGNLVYGSDGQPLVHWHTTTVMIPEIEKEAIRIFSDKYPCWFDGCEEIRKQIEIEMGSIDPNSCKKCEKGAIMRKYIKKVVEILKKQKN